MPLPGWLHVNGVSLSNDVQQQIDHRTTNLTSPIALVLSPPNSVPFPTTMMNGHYQKVENADLPKKLFIDRQIKKVKSLAGLIKGTALSHHASLHSAPNRSPSGDNHPDDRPPTPRQENDNHSSRRHENHERRRPRVSFSDFNKVQFFEDNNDSSQSTHRRHRHRSSKKSTPVITTNHVSPPSIQHSQTLYIPYQSLSRQPPTGYELNIKKQQLIPSSRTHSSRTTHLPDILNQTLPTDISTHEKYLLQREKSLYHFPEPTMEIPMNSSTEISRESTRAAGIRPSVVPDYYDQSNSGTLLNSSSLSSSSTNRQRSSLRTISLRQQFISPIKSKATTFSNNHQPIINPHRSSSLKHSNQHNHSTDDDHDELYNQSLLSRYENRPMTGIHASKHVKPNHVIHMNSKNPFNGNTTIDSSEIHRYHTKSNLHETSQGRFQNALKIVRPPYVTTLQNTHHDLTLQPTINHLNGSIRSPRTISGNGSHEFHIISSTVFV